LIDVRQPGPIVARPIHIKRKKEKNTQQCTKLYIITQTDEKRDELSRYWNETSAADDPTYFSTISSNRHRKLCPIRMKKVTIILASVLCHRTGSGSGIRAIRHGI